MLTASGGDGEAVGDCGDAARMPTRVAEHCRADVGGEQWAADLRLAYDN